MSQDDKKLEAEDAPQDAPEDAEASQDKRAAEDAAAAMAAEEQEAETQEGEDEDGEADREGEGEDEAERLADELAETKDRLLRAVAETENLRRRAVREREDAGKYAISGFARDLLPAADNLRRALDSLTDEIRHDDALSGLISGVEMTERELLAAFERHGIRSIDPLGEKFDHNLHQAMFHVEGSGQPAGTIIEVAQTGYVIAGRLLRPAMVGVAKGANQAEDEAPAHVDTKA